MQNHAWGGNKNKPDALYASGLLLGAEDSNPY